MAWPGPGPSLFKIKHSFDTSTCMKLSLKRLIQSHKAWPNPGAYVCAFYNGFAVFSILDYIILMLFSLSSCKRVRVINKMMMAVRFTCQIKFITVSME